MTYAAVSANDMIEQCHYMHVLTGFSFDDKQFKLRALIHPQLHTQIDFAWSDVINLSWCQRRSGLKAVVGVERKCALGCTVCAASATAVPVTQRMPELCREHRR